MVMFHVALFIFFILLSVIFQEQRNLPLIGCIWEFPSIAWVSWDPDQEAGYFREGSDRVLSFCLPFNAFSQLNYLASEIEMPSR